VIKIIIENNVYPKVVFFKYIIIMGVEKNIKLILSHASAIKRVTLQYGARVRVL
jgi:hypothetical protein